MVEECPKKRWKTQTYVQDSTTIPAIFANEQNVTLEKEDTATSFIDGIILHVTDSELNIFPEQNEDQNSNQIQDNCNMNSEIRRMYLNNAWKVKDSVGNTDFDGVMEEDPNIDWETFISENINH